MTTDKRLYNDVARRIIAMIDSDQFPPGSRLPGERDLAADFGVSRVTVREAQIALQAKGIIEVRTGSGARVLPRKPAQGELPEVSAFELTQARTLFESEGAALAATLVTDEEISEISTILEEMEEETEPHSPLAESADRRFHLAIARASKNAAIVDAVERLWRMRTELPHVKAAYDAICEVDTGKRYSEHSQILDALKARDANAARLAMKHHFACIMEAMLTTAEEAAIKAARRRTQESRQRFIDTARTL